MKTKNGFLILILSIFIFSGSIVLSGCGGGAGSSSGGTALGSSSSPASTITGQVKGGLTAIAGATVQLYGCTAQTESSCTPISTPVSTNSSGGFTIVYNPSSADTTYYLQATEGDIELQAIVPSNIPSGGITINEYSTFVTQEAFNYGQENNLGATASYIEGLMADPTSATPAVLSSTSPLSAIEPYLVTMADDLAACIDASTSPYTSLASTAACTSLESDVTTATASTAPTTVPGILGNIAATLTTYYSNMTNGTDSGALLTMQNNLHSLLPSSPDFTFTFPSAFVPATVEQPPVALISSTETSFQGTVGSGGNSPTSSPTGLTVMSTAGCLQCHTITVSGVTYGPGAPFNNPLSVDYIAPDLSNIGSELSSTGLTLAVNVMNTQLASELSSTLTSSEVASIVTYLGTLTSGGTPALTTTDGGTIMQSAGCFGCHTNNGATMAGFSIAGGVGPDLSTIGSTIDPKGIGIGVNYMVSNIMSSGVASELSSADISTIESYLGTLQGPVTTGYTTYGKPLYEGASSTMVQLQETCLLCHSGPGYNGATTTFSASPGPNFYNIAPIGDGTASDMNSTYFETPLTTTQLNNIVDQINTTF